MQQNDKNYSPQNNIFGRSSGLPEYLPNNQLSSVQISDLNLFD